MKLKGLIIKESIVGPWPAEFKEFTETEYTHALEGDDSSEITICRVFVPQERVWELSRTIADRLLASKYYAHFVDDDRLHVIFPHSIVYVRKGSESDAELCRRIGELFSIPRSQMRFESLFISDHPND